MVETGDAASLSSEVSSLQDLSVKEQQYRRLFSTTQTTTTNQRQEQRRRSTTNDTKDAEDDDGLDVTTTGNYSSPTHRLHLDRLHGRQVETDLLRACYDRVACTGRSEAILLQGKSGSGKSQLVDVSLRNHVSNSDGGGGLYASGKYDQMLKDGDPYSSALASALEDVCALLLRIQCVEDATLMMKTKKQNGDDDDDDDIDGLDVESSSPPLPPITSASERIQSSLEPTDLKLLQQWIPSLRFLVADPVVIGDNGGAEPPFVSMENNNNRNDTKKPTDTEDRSSSSSNSNSGHVAHEAIATRTFGDNDNPTTKRPSHDGPVQSSLSSSTTTTSSVTSMERFKTLLQILVRCMASSEHPLVLFLDDLQWADPASLQVLQTLLTDSHSHHVLLICTIREEELESSCENSSFLQEWVAGSSCSSGDRESATTTTSHGKGAFPLMPTTAIRIGNLQVKTLNQLLLHAFDLKDEDKQQQEKQVSSRTTTTTTTSPSHTTSTFKLAQVVYNKTGGRPYCVVNFLQLLVAESMLAYHHHHHNDDDNKGGGWTWELERIQAMTNVSDSVVPVLMKRVERLPYDTSKALQVASCLGHHFDEMTVKEYMIGELILQQGSEEANREADDSEETEKEEMHERSNYVQNIATATAEVGQRFQTAMTVALQSGLIEAAGGKHLYKFTHDTIQRCFYDLMGPMEQAQRHWMLGKQMLRARCHQQHQETITEQQQHQHSERTMFFLMVDQLNRGAKAIPTLKDRKNLIKLNLEAGHRARSISAFAVAANVLRSAHELLLIGTNEIQKWNNEGDDDDYNMTLHVCTALAEYEGLSGKFARSEVLTSDIISHARTFHDKLPAYFIQMDGLSAQGRLRDAFQLGFPLLEQLGESFPTEPKVRHVLADLIRLSVRLCRSNSVHQLLTRPIMTDPIRLETMKLMKRLCTFAMFLDDANFTGLLSMRMLRRTLSHGICIPSAYAIAIWSITQATLGNTNAAYRYGCVVLDVLKRLRAEDECPAAVAMVYGGALHYRIPLRDLEPIFRRTYAVGFRTGDISYAFMAAYNAVNAQFYTNASLADKERALRECVTRMKAFGQVGPRLAALPLLQMMQNLMNESDDPLVLSGNTMVQEDVLQQAEESNNKAAYMAVHMCRWTLALSFWDWNLARLCATNVVNEAMVARSHFTCVDYLAFLAMTALVSTKATRRRRVPRRAKRAMQTLQTMYEDGKEDALSPLLLLEAECANLKKKKNTGNDLSGLEELFRKAVDAASLRVSMRARALERCGQVLCDRGAPEMKVKEVLLEAKDAYAEWGAIAKVNHLEETIKTLAQSPRIKAAYH